jgi:hypothetical protein
MRFPDQIEANPIDAYLIDAYPIKSVVVSPCTHAIPAPDSSRSIVRRNREILR